MENQVTIKDEIIAAIGEKLQSLEQRLDNKLFSMEERLDTKILSSEERLGDNMLSLEGRIDGKFRSIEGHVGALDLQFDEVNSRLDGVCDELRQHGIMLEEIESQIHTFSEEQDILHARIDRHEKRISKLEAAS